jgi:hypothetical protein
VAEFLWECEDEVPVLDIEEVAEQLPAPAVGARHTARGTERCLAAVGDQPNDAAVAAFVDVAAKSWGTTGKGSGNDLTSPLIYLVSLPGEIASPVVSISQDLGDRNRTPQDFHGVSLMHVAT